MRPADLHIVGGGPAGLSAAHTAVVAGARVCLIDNDHAPGGQIWRGGPDKWTDPRALEVWTDLHAHPRFMHLRSAQVIGSVDSHTLLLEVDDKPVRVDFERLLICSGARELFLPFPGWTLPGVTGAGGLQALIKGGMPVQDRRIVIAGSGPLLLPTAVTAMEAGAKVSAIVEHQGLPQLSAFGMGLLLRHKEKFRQAASLFARLWKVPYLTGARIVEARGLDAVQSVVIKTGRNQKEFACDFLAAGFGLVPDIDLACSLRCDIANDAIAVDSLQRTNQAVPRFRGAAGAQLRAGCVPEGDVPARYHRLPLRGRHGRQPGAVPELARGEAGHAGRHGGLPGQDLRRGLPVPVRLDAPGRADPDRAGECGGAVADRMNSWCD